MKIFIHALLFLLFGALLFAQEPASPTARKDDQIFLRAKVVSVVPLTDFAGKAIPVHFDPRFALTLRLVQVTPAVPEFVAGKSIALGIHSPATLFAESPVRIGTSGFSLHREMRDGKVVFSDLRFEGSAPPIPATDGVCAENDQPVGYPLTGWVGTTNIGDSVTDVTVEVRTAPEKPPIATAKTDDDGRFSFPSLATGKFYLRIAEKVEGGVIRADETVVVRKGNHRIVCMVAEMETPE